MRNEFAAFILTTPEDDYILQLRDNNPTIADPNKLSLFAGRLEEGETQDEAAERELEEETTLRDQPIRYIGDYQKDPKRHGAEGVCHVYAVEDVNLDDITVHEGQGYRLVARRHFGDIPESEFALISYDILVWYRAKQQAAV